MKRKDYGDTMKVNHSKEFIKTCKFSEIEDKECFLHEDKLYLKTIEWSHSYMRINVIDLVSGEVALFSGESSLVTPVHAFVNYRYMLNN